MRWSPLVLLSAIGSLVASCTTSDGDKCSLPGPCEGPQHVILVTFKRGATDADMDAVNRSVDGTIIYRGVVSEDLYVPGGVCEALDKLRRDQRVAAAIPEVYAFPNAPADAGLDACPPSNSPVSGPDSAAD